MVNVRFLGSPERGAGHVIIRSATVKKIKTT